MNAAVVRYYESTVFTKELAEGTQKSQRSQIERFRRGNGDKHCASSSEGMCRTISRDWKVQRFSATCCAR